MSTHIVRVRVGVVLMSSGLRNVKQPIQETFLVVKTRVATTSSQIAKMATTCQRIVRDIRGI